MIHNYLKSVKCMNMDDIMIKTNIKILVRKVTV